MTSQLLHRLSSRVALDLGTASSRLYVPGQGVVADEASYVAMYERGAGSGDVVAVGNRAKELCGRTAERLTSTTPIVGSRIKHLERAEILVRHLLPASRTWRPVSRLDVIATIPVDATPIERMAYVEAARGAGAADLHLVTDVMAVAIGSGVSISDTRGAVVLTVGAGTSTVALVTLNGVVASRAIKIAGDIFDERLVDHIRRSKGVIIGKGSAERAKIAVGAARMTGDNPEVTLTGSLVATGMPVTVTVSRHDVVKAVREPIREIVGLVKGLLDETPPEIASDIIDSGIALVGGSALLPEFDELLSEQLGLPVSLGEDPATTTITGCGVMLERWSKFKHLLTSV